MGITKRLMEGAYSGWEFETTNTEWDFPIFDVTKRRR
jgi:hypothetical protein